MTRAEKNKAILNAQMKGGKAAVLKLKAKWRGEAAKKRQATQRGKKPSTSRGSSADTAVSRTKENIDRGRTAALNTLITAVPGGFIVKAGRVAGKIFKTRAAARNAAKQLKAPTPKLPAPKPKAPPVRSSKTTPNTLSAATQAKKRLTSTPNTSTPKPPVRQSRTTSSAMDAQRAKAAKNAADKKRREDAAKKIAEKKRLQKAAAERKAMEAKRQKAVRQSQTAKKAAQGLRKTPNTSTPKPPVRQSRTGSPAMNAQRKRAAADLAAKTKRQKAVDKIKKQKADKPSVGSIVGAGSKLPAIVGSGKQSPRPPAKKPKPPAVVAKPPAVVAKPPAVVAKPPATRTATSPRPKTERPKPPPPKGSKSSPRPRNRRPNPLAAVPLAVTGTPKPKPPKKRAKDEVFDTDLVASRKPSSVSAGIDTDDFSEERDSYEGLYDKKKEDPHWREIKKASKALGLKYMVPRVDEHGDELPPEMRDVSGGYTGGQVKKLKKKTASKPKRKTSATKKRKGFSGRGQGAALRGF